MFTRARRHATASAPRPRSDTGQAALVLVIAFSLVLTIFGGVMVTTIVNNAPIVAQTTIQRYAYRAMLSGLNSYTSAINANPYLAACNTTNAGSSICAGITYQSWSQVGGTDTGNGVIPELYKFDNPQSVTASTNGAITDLEVQIVGAAGFPGHYAYYSTIAHYVPKNGFLNSVWWSNFESEPFQLSGAQDTASSCKYFWAVRAGQVASNPCTGVEWQSGDAVTGPVFSNDSLYTTGSPSFSPNPSTADPQCEYISGTGYGTCTTDTPKTYGQPQQNPPADNSQLAATAIQGGCYYTGPTSISFTTNGQMTVVSKESPNYPGTLTQQQPSTNLNTCPTNGSGAFPSNGVVYVAAATGTWPSSDNPFYSSTSGLSQLSTCGGSSCYYDQSTNSTTEGDAFVGDAWTSGGFSGHLTIAASNNVIIDNEIIYNDCTFGTPVSPAVWTACAYNNATGSTPNDVLGLIANNYIEVNRPLYNDSASGGNKGNPLPDCNGTTWVPPLCDPSTSQGDPTSTQQGLTIEAALLALNQSFVVNNYNVSGSEGILGVYGSIQQDARGPVGLAGGGTGYLKNYFYDSRLPLYSPPHYLTPGTPSWALDSSVESYTGKCPTMPPAQSVPTVQTSGDLTFNQSGWTACTGP